MRKISWFVCLLVSAVMSTLPVAALAAAKPVWQDQWEKTLSEARKEGSVVITAVLGSEGRAAITEGFRKAYGIPVESISGRGAEMTEKVLRERRAGLYNYDVYISGAATALGMLKPAGALSPLDQALILPEVTDTGLMKKVWWQGKLCWVDADHTVLAPALRLNLAVAINTNLVKEGEIKSYRDLLAPMWQGKMVLNDPTVSGTGDSFFAFTEDVLGRDYLVELARAKPIILRDSRQMVEWLSRGKVAIVVGPTPDMLAELVRAGAPIKGLMLTEGTWLTGGSSNIALYNRPPHPNAAKIFINWYLTKEGQSIVAPAAGSQSVRLDVSTGHLLPDQVRQPGMKYWVKDTEEIQSGYLKRSKRAMEIFGALLGK